MDEEIFEVEQVEEVVVEVEETAGWVSSENVLHSTLPDHNDPGAHEISAINGLEDRLASIEMPKTVYSDGYNTANYYKCSEEVSVGYFVSLASDTEVVLCNGQNGIFGVIVDAAGFVGRQDVLIPKETDGTYKLVVTSGHTLVRHELDVTLGDYVVSNTSGYAKKSGSGRGYKVFAFADVNGTSYAVISLDIQGDTIDKLGAEVNHLDARLDAVETDIIVANNVAQEALSKIENIDTSKLVTSDKLEVIENAVNKAETDASDALTQATNAATTSAQAKAIAESAVLTAEVAKDVAVKEATEAVLSSSELRDEFSAMEDQINDLEGQVTIVTKKASGQYETVDTIDGVVKEEDTIYYAKDTGIYHYYDYDTPGWAETTNPREAGLSVAIAGLQVETDENSANINSLTSWQGTADISMARIEQKADANGAYIQSTVSNIDRYTVGPHSQAYGFTLEQAASILEEGMIYVPTESITETYEYVEDETAKTYERVFTPGYLYQWGKLTDYPYGWITVDKNYKETEVNTSGPSVYFVDQEPVTVDTTHGYWYANTAEIKNKDGQVTDKYKSYTLYKWDLPYKYQAKNDKDETVDVEEYHWVAVATLAGNSSNRAVSQIRQDANSIELRVTNTEGSAASSKQWIDDNSANIQDVVSWKSKNGESLVTFMQTADENYASASQVAKIVDKDGNINEASIVTVVNDNASDIYLSADNVTIDGFTSFKAKVEDVEGKAVYNTQVEYARSSSATTFTATTDWSVDAPQWKADEYMWQRTVITKGDGTSTTSNPTCIQGARGETGQDGVTPTVGENGNWFLGNTDTGKKATGEDGVSPTIGENGNWWFGDSDTGVRAKGEDAPTVTKAAKQYYLSLSNTDLVGGNWSTTPANFTKGSYMWTRDVYTMSDESIVEGDSVLDNTFTTISSWCSANDTTLIDGAHIATGTIDAQKITSDFVSALNLEVGNQVKMGDDAEINWNNVTGREEGVTKIAKDEISTATIRAEQVKTEDLNAFGATIGGWSISKDSIEADGIGLYSDDAITQPSLVDEDKRTSVRICTYPTPTTQSIEIVQEITAEDGEEIIDFSLPASIGRVAIEDSSLKYAYRSEPAVQTCVLQLEESTREINGVTYMTLEHTTSYTDMDLDFIRIASEPALFNIEYVTHSNELDRGSVSSDVFQNFVVEHNVNNQVCTVYCILTTTDGVYPDWYAPQFYRYEATIDISYYKNESDKSYTLESKMTSSGGQFILKGDYGYIYEIDANIIQWKIGSFNVLDDGSLYASNARISGHIEATSGSFEGNIVAETGTFGGLVIQDGEIYHETTGLSLLSDGVTTIDQLETNEIKVNDTAKVRRLTSVNDDSVCLSLVDNTATTQHIKPKVEATVLSEYVEREFDWFTTFIQDKGEVSITVSTSAPLYYAKDFVVKVCYKHPQYNLIKEGTWNFKIRSGSDSKTITIPHARYIDDNSYTILVFNHAELLTSDEYDETASKSVTAISSSAHFVPTKTGLELGSSNVPWNNIYSSTGTVKTSDANKKHDIVPIDGKYSAMYDMLTPVSFKLNDGTSDRTHTGLTAQGMKAAMDACGIDVKDFAAYCSWTDLEGNESCGIRYEELIALNIYEIQRLKARVKELEEKLKD